MGVCGSLGWGIYRDVGYGVGRADGITFGSDFGSDPELIWFFDGLNDTKTVGKLLDGSLE